MNGTVDVFLTSDQNLRYQQNLATIGFSIIVLVVADNRLPTLGRKYISLGGIDPATGAHAALYHPRQHVWAKHFVR